MSVSDLSDESLLRYYDSIRNHVEADRGNEHKFMTANSIREYAESLRLELCKRRLPCAPINWWTEQQTETVTLPKSDARDLVGFDPDSVPEPEEIKLGKPDLLVEPSEDLKKNIAALLKPTEL